MAATKFDDVFMGMLQHCGKIEPFLDVIFSFLSRRTDFFHLMHKKDDKLGFPPGIAEKMLIKMFEKYQERVLKNDPIYMKWKESQKNKGEGGKSQRDHCETKLENNKANNVSSGSDRTRCTSNIAEKADEEIPISSSVDIDTTNERNIPNEVKSCEETSTSHDQKSNPSERLQTDDCFNGGKTDKYCWSQSLSDVDVKIPIPLFVKASKELSVQIDSHSINVSLKNDPPADSGLQSRVLLAGKVKEKIRCDESLWSLIPGEHIEINLEKFQHKWWDGLLEGDEEIDRSSIDTTQQVHDFDETTQNDIRKVMYDQQQKMMGKPTSDEQKTHAMLEKAWDAKGSPFKGTPFDPSRVNMSGGS